MSNSVVLEDYEVDPLSMEEKIILAHEGPIELPPWEITEIVQEAMGNLPRNLDIEQVDLIFDVIYDAISDALEAVRPQI